MNTDRRLKTRKPAPSARAKFAQRFLYGVSWAPCVLPIILAAPAAAQAQEKASVERRVLRGADGRDGEANVLIPNRQAARGQDGGSVNLENSFSKTSATGNAVMIGSVGGLGGNGASTAWVDVDGAEGGRGGTMSLVQTGLLTGSGNQSGPPLPTSYAGNNPWFHRDARWANTGGTALLILYSQGGSGGFGNAAMGRGGAGGSVTLDLRSSAETNGTNYAAIWARSLGGRAGTGGTTQGNVANLIGGAGGKVHVELAATSSVTTRGANSTAVIAESIGGTGAERGNAFFSKAYVSNGGAAGSVEVVSRGYITALGAGSAGILAQSIGGHGGDQDHSGGQPGGAGGKGGTVGVSHTGTLATWGSYSFGLLAQSLGGTGGKGGGGVFGGGDGGKAGAGGEAHATNYGTIGTHGIGATAMVVQSVGGGNATGAFQLGAIKPGVSGAGGGQGGTTFFGSGGSGGTGGDGGNVRATNLGTITTTGKEAYGLLAQSVGGGGGAGSSSQTLGFGVSIAVGGHGGGGGNGGEVVVSGAPSAFTDLGIVNGKAPSIITSGVGATALIATSVGGGGGVGGAAAAKSAGVVASVSIAVGGAGGDGGNGGKVLVDNTSLISTKGREALGIQAKSVGGGGGNGGNANAYALAVAPPDLPAIAVTFAVGGKGGKGGSGDEVTVNNRASITTHGNDATGIEAMSVGGGGGSGGTATSASDMISGYLNIGLAVSVGGSGGGGGNGNAVAVRNYGGVQTFGDFATGIFAQSVGGGGGNGGSGSAMAAPGLSWNEITKNVAGEALPLANSVSARIAVGGSGGDGGNGAAVTTENFGLISAAGRNSFGIFSQSIGGGGGNGGGYMASGKGDLSGKLTIGGSGGKGGKGGDVTVVNGNGARIELGGAGTVGIFAQSVGGGGGNGGSFSGTDGKPKEVGRNGVDLALQILDDIIKVDGVLVGLLGDTDEKAVEDYKFLDKNSPAQKKIALAKGALKILNVLAEKDKSWPERVAKAGGFAAAGYGIVKLKAALKEAYKNAASKPKVELPSIDLTLAFGGSGNVGGDGGVVKVDNDGKIVTTADNSWGILAQSIGGGGGRGGSGVATGNNNINATFAFGADGGKGGKGGDVTLKNVGSIATGGAGSMGIFAQSIGGGGGTGAFASSGNSISLSSNVRMGGDAGQSSPGGTVKVTNSGTIETGGREAHAMVAQSVGGGGGTFLFNRPDPTSSSTLASNADEKELIDLAYQMLKKAGAIPAEDSLAGGAEYDISSTIIPMPTSTLSYGGKGSGGGAGGTVDLSHSGTINTHGMGAFGIFAQSIGGGGGFSVDASKSGFLEQSTKMGGEGGAGGSGGKIDLVFSREASVRTAGAGAHAVFLQSIGGGGGYSGVGYEAPPGVKAEFVRDSASSGSGGKISIKMGSTDSLITLSTSGKAAHAIFAQSLGGGGGWTFDVNGKGSAVKDNGKTRSKAIGRGETIDLNTRGQILAFGEDAYGIFLQSGVQKTDGTLDRARTGGTISIVHDGMIIGGSGKGAGIRIDGGGSENKITLKPGSHLSAISGTAILGSVNKDVLENEGTIHGSIDLAPADRLADDRFTNKLGGTYAIASSGFVNLGHNGSFFNEGAFSIGGSARVTGSYEQSSRGRLIVSFMNPLTNNGLKNGHVEFQGKAALAGTIEPNVSWLLPGDYRIVTSSGGISGSTEIGGPQGNGLPMYWGVAQTWNSITLSPKARFTTAYGVTFSRDQDHVARYLQSAWDASSSAQATVFPRFLGLKTAGQYTAALDELSLEPTQYVTNTKIKDARFAMKSAMSCPAFENATMVLSEGECVWGRISGGYSRMGASHDEGGYRQQQTSIRMGGQKEFAPGWFIGATASFTRGELEDRDGITGSKTDSYDASVALKRQLGNWLLAASATVGRTEQKNLRAMTIGPTTAIAQSDSHVEILGARFRAAYELPFANWYLRPYLDVDALHLRTPAFMEHGAPGLDLGVLGQTKTIFAVNPTIEIGGRFDIGSGYWARPYASVGFTALSSNHFTTRSVLLGAPLELGTFESRSRIPDRLLDLGAGLQISSGKGLEFTGEYQAQTGEGFVSHTGSARLSWRF